MSGSSWPINWELTAEARCMALGGLLGRLTKEGKPINFEGELWIYHPKEGMQSRMKGQLTIMAQATSNGFYSYMVKTSNTTLVFEARGSEWRLEAKANGIRGGEYDFPLTNKVKTQGTNLPRGTEAIFYSNELR